MKAEVKLEVLVLLLSIPAIEFKSPAMPVIDQSLVVEVLPSLGGGGGVSPGGGGGGATPGMVFFNTKAKYQVVAVHLHKQQCVLLQLSQADIRTL